MAKSSCTSAATSSNGIHQTPDVRDRPAEFARRDPIPKADLLKMLEATFDEADAVLGSLSPNDLLTRRRIQGFEVATQAAIADSVAHLSGHTQEIIWITRARVGPDYRFFWKPPGPEQG